MKEIKTYTLEIDSNTLTIQKKNMKEIKTEYLKIE